MTPSEPWKPLALPLRSAAIYSAVIDSLQVESNPRYRPKNGKTFCNIFVWDVTRAMGCEVPHWVKNGGGMGSTIPTDGPAPGMREQTANDMVDWIPKSLTGWMPCPSATIAQEMANDGHPVIAAWKNPNGTGHIAMVRPNTTLAAGIIIAQAGSRNFSSGTLAFGFGARPVEFFWHP